MKKKNNIHHNNITDNSKESGDEFDIENEDSIDESVSHARSSVYQSDSYSISNIILIRFINVVNKRESMISISSPEK